MFWRHVVFSEAQMRFEGVDGGIPVFHVPATYERAQQPLRPAQPVPNKITLVRIVEGWHGTVGDDNWNALKDYVARIGAEFVEVSSQSGFDSGGYGTTNL